MVEGVRFSPVPFNLNMKKIKVTFPKPVGPVFSLYDFEEIKRFKTRGELEEILEKIRRGVSKALENPMKDLSCLFCNISFYNEDERRLFLVNSNFYLPITGVAKPTQWILNNYQREVEIILEYPLPCTFDISATILGTRFSVPIEVDAVDPRQLD